GGSAVIPQPKLTSPLLLPNETNLPLADGTIQQSGTNSSGQATITNTNATNVSAANGERPGFDPRMSNFPYTIEFLDGPAAGQILNVGSVSQDILSFANTTAFASHLMLNGSLNTAGNVVFYGTPDQSQLGTLFWKQAVVNFSGQPKIGDVWSLVLNGHAYSTPQVTALTAVPSILAKEILDQLPSDYTASITIGLLGNAELVIKRADGTSFTAQFQINSVASDNGTVSGTPDCDAGTLGVECGKTWTLASYRFTSIGPAGSTWSLNYDGHTTAGESATSIGALTTALAGDIVSDYKPLVSGSTVTFATG